MVFWGLASLVWASTFGLSVVAAERTGRQVVTAESVEKLGVNLSSVRSRESFLPFIGYLGPAGVLGYAPPFGLMGHWGPYAASGAIGEASLNPSQLFKSVGNFEAFSKFATANGGPMSAKGPLGPQGPLAAYRTLEDASVFGPWTGYTNQLMAGGLVTPYGPLGIMSPLGAYGPLGPIGDHGGFAIDEDGDYVNAQGEIKRTLRSSLSGHARDYELFENYSEERALALRDLDTSFTVQGTATISETRRFTVTSASDQLVTVVAIPLAPGHAWKLAIRDAKGREVAASNSSMYVNWAQLQVRKGEVLSIDVALSFSLAPYWPNPYRLFVVGSGPEFKSFDVTGAHVLVKDWH